jgi:hypothetical protein
LTGLVVAKVVAIFAEEIAGALGLDFLLDFLEEFLLIRDFFVIAIGTILQVRIWNCSCCFRVARITS